MFRFALAWHSWARIEPLLPDRTPKRSGRWRDHRQVIDAIAFKLQTGTQWAHLPEKYGNWRGIYNRLRTWAVDGTWDRVFTALMAQPDADEDLAWAVSADATIVCAHQHATGARKGGSCRRACQPRHRSIPWRTDHEDPPRCRCPLPAPGVRSHRGAGRRHARLHGRHGSPARSPTAWSSPHKAGRGPRRQGLLISRDPRPPSQARYPGGHPRTSGPAGPPAATRQPGR